MVKKKFKPSKFEQSLYDLLAKFYRDNCDASHQEDLEYMDKSWAKQGEP